MNMNLANICKRIVLLGIPAFLSACFDYHEKIELREDFSGSVRISYTVPVSEEGRSRLSFLPANEEDIKIQYEEVVPSLRFQLKNIKITPVETDSKAKKEDKRLKVSYRLEFKDPKILEYTPLENTKIIKSAGYLEIRRNFPALQNIKQAKGFILKRISKYLTKRFSGHSISYSTLLAEGFELSTNKGRMYKNTEHKYNLPLVETLGAADDIQWSFSLKRK